MNPFDILGIPPGSSKDVAQGAYRKLAMLHHPDRGGSETRFKEVKAAYESIERGYTAPAQPKRAPQQRWTKPTEAYAGYAAETGYNPYKQKAKPQPQAPKVTVIQAYPVQGQSEHFIVRASLREAFNGFVCEVPFQGVTRRINVPRGAPDGLVFSAPQSITPSPFDRVSIVLRLNQSLFRFNSIENTPTITAIIDGVGAQTQLVGHLTCDVQVEAREASRGSTVELQDFLGNRFSVLILAGCTSGMVITVPNVGYAHWFPVLKRASLNRGSVIVRVHVSEMVPMSTVNSNTFI